MIQEFCDELNLYLVEQFQYKTAPARVHFDTINVNRKKVELYIRFKTGGILWDNETLVLARMAFDSQRKGQGRNLLVFLVNQAKKYRYMYIGLEQTNKKAAGFAAKYGFRNISENRHWLVDVGTLRNELRKHQGISLS